MRSFLFIAILFFSACGSNKVDKELNKDSASISGSGKIQVLNFGTFHFGYTPDANQTEFDERSEKAQSEAREIAKMIARFRPTIICVEKNPEKDRDLKKAYQEYLNSPSELSTKDGEISMLAFEVGRLCEVKSVYGIDNQMGYNYSVGDFIESSPDYENSIDPDTYLQLTNNPFKDYPEIAERANKYDSLSLLGKLKLINEPLYLEYSINTNADKLLYVGIENGFEGADNAAIFYHRNMKIYSNLNRIKMNRNDRVFNLMGAAHTAFLKEFMDRSPKFEMVNTLKFLQ